MSRLSKLLALLGAAALIAAACSGQNQAQQEVNDDPESALQEAVENLADFDGTSLEFSIEGSTDSLVKLSEDGLGEDEAQQILDSSLQMTTKEGEDIEDQQAEFVVNVAGQESAVELKSFGSTFYARADVAGIAETFGADQSSLEVFRQQASAQPGFEFVGTLLDGEWVAVTGANQLAEQLTGQSVENQTEQQKAMADELADSLQENADVEAGDEEGPGGHVIVSLPVRALYEDFKDISQAAGSLATGGVPLPDATELPDEDVVLDVWIDDAEITQVELDIVQFADWENTEDFPEGVDDLRLRMTVDEFTGSLDEPDAATEVDAGELMGLFTGGAFQGAPPTGEGSGGSDELCGEIEAALEGQPDAVIEEAKKQYGDICPNLGG